MNRSVLKMIFLRELVQTEQKINHDIDIKHSDLLIEGISHVKTLIYFHN